MASTSSVEYNQVSCHHDHAGHIAHRYSLSIQVLLFWSLSANRTSNFTRTHLDAISILQFIFNVEITPKDVLFDIILTDLVLMHCYNLVARKFDSHRRAIHFIN